jgi:hypothetical protein
VLQIVIRAVALQQCLQGAARCLFEDGFVVRVTLGESVSIPVQAVCHECIDDQAVWIEHRKSRNFVEV